MQEREMRRSPYKRPVTALLLLGAVVVCTHVWVVQSFLAGTAVGGDGLPAAWGHELEEALVKRLVARTQFDVIEEDVERIAVVREVDTPPLREVRAYILRELELHPDWKVELDTFEDDTPMGRKRFTNIVATWSPYKVRVGRGSAASNRRIVLAAHYDSKLFADEHFIAATDSAVSCALLLDLVRTLDRELRPLSETPMKGVDEDLSLQLIFFDGEEAFVEWTATDSIYGARHLAAKWERMDAEGMDEFSSASNGLQNIELFVLLDLLGAKPMPHPEIPSYFSATSAAHLALQRLERRLISMRLVRAGGQFRKGSNYYFSPGAVKGYIQDDHLPFLQREVPVLHLIPPRFPQVWHKPGDNLDAVDWAQVEDYAAIFRVFVAQYLNLPVH